MKIIFLISLCAASFGWAADQSKLQQINNNQPMTEAQFITQLTSAQINQSNEEKNRQDVVHCRTRVYRDGKWVNPKKVGCSQKKNKNKK